MRLTRPPLLSLRLRWGAELRAGARGTGAATITNHGGGAECQGEAARGGPGGGAWTWSPAWRGVEEEEGLCGEGREASERAGSATVHLWEEGESGDEAQDATWAGAEESEGTAGKYPDLEIVKKKKKHLIHLRIWLLRSYNILPLALPPIEAVPAPWSDHELPPRAPAGAWGANPGPWGWHGALGAEVPWREHHEAVCHGGGCHCRCPEVKITGPWLLLQLY